MTPHKPLNPLAVDVPMTVFEYDLPPERIAVRPVEPRDTAKMFVVRRSDESIVHRQVRDLPEYLDAEDLLVFNKTAVLPARLIGRRVDSGGRIEGLFLREIKVGRWSVMLRSNGRLREGTRVELIDAQSAVVCRISLVEKTSSGWIVTVDSDLPASDLLNRCGRTPLPPYILKSRGEDSFADADDQVWYQTVYANRSDAQSVAAPTAGLHFTDDLLQRIDQHGVNRADVTLHVGAGTFKPVTADTLGEHEMHREWCETPPETIDALSNAKRDGDRVFAVGTTTVRTLESLPEIAAMNSPQRCFGETDLLIAPGYEFRHVDGMLTNFHLPRSTLLALVGAMLGLDRTLDIYRTAVRENYRFYSYGDAMLILP